MRKVLSLIAVVLCGLPAMAGDDGEVRRHSVADSQLQSMGITAPSALVDETSACAVYGVPTGGFVVVNKQAGGEELVLGYSSSVYTPGQMPCGFNWWLNAVNEVQQHGAVKRDSSRKYTPVLNLLSTQWGQDAPYNNKCPAINGQRPPSGCVATAMAQVMNYYRWPEQGQGTGGYYVNDQYTPAEVNGTYDWDRMPTGKGKSVMTENIKKAVSTLLFDCGKAVKMQYDIEGSGAFQFDQALALARNFQYDSLSLQYCDRALYPDADVWMDMISAELQAGRPILYSGMDAKADGGHSFILSGIDENGKVYVNWGWDGYGDGYYAVDLLDANNGEFEFSKDQEMNIGIKPMDLSGPDGVYRSKWAVYYSAEPSLTADRQQLRLPYYYVYNAHFLPFVGDVGLYLQSTDGQGYAQLCLLEEMTTEELNYGDGYTNLVAKGDHYTYTPLIISFDQLPEGCYQVWWGSKAVQDTEVQQMLDEDTGAPFTPFYIAKNDDGTLSYSTQEITTTAIRTVTSDSDGASARYYRLDGRPAGAAHRGLTIVRQGSTLRKVIR